MAELNSAQMVTDQVSGRRPGFQNLRFVVWPKNEPAKVITLKKDGKDEKVNVPRITLWRATGNAADFKSWKLSAFWEHVLMSTWPHWKFFPDVELQKAGEEDAGSIEPWLETEGPINEKTGFAKSGKSTQSVTWNDLPYRWNTVKGQFGYDKHTSITHPLSLGSVARLRWAMRNQLDNPDTAGSRDDSSRPKILFTPWMLHGTKSEMKEAETFAENFEVFKSWAADPEKGNPGKIVHWELEKVPPQ